MMARIESYLSLWELNFQFTRYTCLLAAILEFGGLAKRLPIFFHNVNESQFKHKIETYWNNKHDNYKTWQLHNCVTSYVTSQHLIIGHNTITFHFNDCKKMWFSKNTFEKEQRASRKERFESPKQTLRSSRDWNLPRVSDTAHARLMFVL